METAIAKKLFSTNVRSHWGRRRRAFTRRWSRRTLGASVGALAHVAPRTALDIAAFLFFKPARSAAHPRETPVLEAAMPLRIVSHNRTLCGWSWGSRDAPPVLLVHGWSGRAGQLGAFVKPLLAQGHRVVAFDLRGHGGSTGSQATIVELAEDLLAIDAYVGPLDAVIAHSFGGPVTMLALLAGLRCHRAVFIAPPFDSAGWIGVFAGMLRFDVAMSDRFQRRLEATVGLAFEEISGALLAPAMTKPLLIIHDEDDDAVPIRAGERLAASWPNATLQRTRGLGHQRILSDPEVVTAALEFMAHDAP